MAESSLPLVSCIMPTADRPAFVPLALRYFEAQDYENRELIVMDDGAQSLADLMPDDPRVRYIRLDHRRPLGEKRNLCNEAARGDLILHWDDDDWFAPHRIGYQVTQLLQSGREVCGLQRMLFYDIARGQPWLYEFPTHRFWLAGGSLLYTRRAWRRAPFQSVSSGEDTRFVLQQQAAQALSLADYAFYVAIIHRGNTSPKLCSGQYWSRWQGDIGAVMGEDLDAYRNLAVDPPKQAKTTALRSRAAVEAPHARREKTMKLHLGHNDRQLPDHINVDHMPNAGERGVDLTQPWPWQDSSVDHVVAWDVIEHLPDKIQTMNELWRILKPDAIVEIAVPTTDGPGAFQDPTHVSYWNRRSFNYYEAGSPYRERFAEAYGIRASFRTMREQIESTIDGPRLTIVLAAVKP